MSDELKPCPFCGGEADAWEYEDEQDVLDPISLGYIDTRCITWYCVGCESCEMSTSRLSRDDAVTAWNTRAERTCRMEPAVGGGWYCSECHIWVAPDAMANATEHMAPRFCLNCCAKVVG